MIVNFNVGLLGHVDSGKTSIAKELSSIASTAAFDKNPQSKDRGITLDLGFSALIVEAPHHLRQQQALLEQLQITFVDCPGHASLIRTVIGGSQIIDLMILVIDAQKGIQLQTAECIILGELFKKKLLVVVNKVDLLNESTREKELLSLNTKIRKFLTKTTFANDVPIVDVSAKSRINIQELLQTLVSLVFLPERNINAPFLMFVDHCFSIKGQGTICTGTVVDGQITVNDMVEIPAIREKRKVKSIQMFRRPVQAATMGDRVGICLTQFNAKLLERGIIAHPGYIKPIFAICIYLKKIKYYKFAIKSKSKMHISIGHETVMGVITLFREAANKENEIFDINKEYEYVEELNNPPTEVESAFAIIEFENPIFALSDGIIVASKLDLDVHSKCCRLSFWGRIQWMTESSNYATEQLPKFKVFKNKTKQGTLQRFVTARQAIVQNLFKKESNRDQYIGKPVELSTGEKGVIDGIFGQSSRVKVTFAVDINEETLKSVKSGPKNDIYVILKIKKYIFSKNQVYLCK